MGVGKVVTTGQARDALRRIAKRFDDGGGEPVYFGSHRRTRVSSCRSTCGRSLLEQAEDELDTGLVRDRLAAMTDAG